MPDEVKVTVSFSKIFSLPKYKRSKKAVRRLKREIMRKLKVEEVKISPSLNQVIWSHGDKLAIRRITLLAKVDREASVAVLEPLQEKAKEEEQVKQQAEASPQS